MGSQSDTIHTRCLPHRLQLPSGCDCLLQRKGLHELEYRFSSVIILFFGFRVQPSLLRYYPKNCGGISACVSGAPLVPLPSMTLVFLGLFFPCSFHPISRSCCEGFYFCFSLHFSEAFPGWLLRKVQGFVV